MSKQAMTFEQIEDCYPDGASVNEYGEIIVSAQWLHDFAHKVEEAIKQHDAEPVAFDEFNEWMNREMPSGIIIGNSGWWASRIYKRFISASPQPTKGEQ